MGDKITLTKWRRVSYAMQACMREGDQEGARKYAYKLLHFMQEMGLLDDNYRQGPTSSNGYPNNGMVKQTEVKIRNTS